MKTFDQAFQSRIHLSLRYDDLSPESKKELWTAFTRKTPGPTQDLNEEELGRLSEIVMNGRQIKNTVKLASALANGENQPLGYQHLMRVVNVQEDWNGM